MLPNLPFYLSLVFGFITGLTLWFVYRTFQHATTSHTRQFSNAVLTGLLLWLVIQAVLTASGIYRIAVMPPRIVLFGLLPAALVISLLFTTAVGRRLVDSLPLVHITWLHTVRVVVELVLYGLFVHKAVPEIMTFEGRNFDILAGLSAPLMAWFGIRNGKPNRWLLLGWNLVCLGLLLNIVTIAFLSAPTPWQRFGLEQPNIAISYFPFSWLPTFVVPVVLANHLIAIRRLLKNTDVVMTERKAVI